MKAKLFFAATMLFTTSMFSQTLSDAIKLTNNEQYDNADAAFQKLIQSQPTSGEIYFYYGENFFKNENAINHFEMAGKMYQKGADVNATGPLCYVGLGKLQWYAHKDADAKANFYKATTLAAGKNATVLMKIAEVYTQAEAKNLTEAAALLAQAAKLEPKNPEVYIYTGDVFLEQNDGTQAVNNYEKASSLDPKNVVAKLRQGQVWNRAKNYDLAIETYKKALLIDSTFAPAYRELAEILHRATRDKLAAAQYKKYLQLNNDCGAKARYAGFTNGAKLYQESIDACKEAMKCAPDGGSAFLYRYLAYDQYENTPPDYAGGLDNINVFLSKISPDKIIPMDYEYRAKLESKTSKDSLAILDYKKALELQPEKIELNGDIAGAFLKMKKYPDAINFYKIKIATGKVTINDYFGLTRSYFYSKDFVNADSAASQMIKMQPDQSIGYIWRAKCNSQLDPKNEKWSAKPFYEQYLGKLKPEELTQPQNKNYLVETYNYLAAYYAGQKDCANTKLYMQKVLEVDPTNQQAKKVIGSLKC